MIELRHGDRRAAFDVPFEVYREHPQYITPMWSDLDRILDPARNPFSTDGHGRMALFTAHRQGRPLGRIVASIHDASNARHATQRGQFGFFDCADDPEIAETLLRAAEQWLRERGASEIAGNFNLTAMQMVGVLTGGFEHAPYTDMMWSPPHISAHLRRNGYDAIFPMTTFETDLASANPSRLTDARHAAIEEDPAFTWLTITRSSFEARLADARTVLNAGFADNPMFVPLTPAEYDFQAGEMMWVMDPRLSIVAHHHGQPVGVIVCIPDINPLVRACGGKFGLTTPWHFLQHRMTRDRAIGIYYAVAPEFHGRGINRIMMKKTLLAARAAGYRKFGTTWIADVNAASLKQMELIGARPLHRLHIFCKSLVAA